MRTSRITAALAGTAAGVLLLAGPAWAHVTVNSPGATQGGFAKLTFRVPTEQDTPTVKLEVVFPKDAPLAFVSVKPHPGWTYTVTKVKAPAGLKSDDGPVEQVVSAITWAATAGGIKPGEFDEFDVSAGPLPKVDQLVFKALQTYQNGDVVRWIETGPGDLEHPAPVLKLASAAASDTPAPGPSASVTAAPTVTAGVLPTTDGDDDSEGIAVAGLGVGAVGLLVGGTALVRTRRRTV